jgi:hypothetical protein
VAEGRRTVLAACRAVLGDELDFSRFEGGWLGVAGGIGGWVLACACLAGCGAVGLLMQQGRRYEQPAEAGLLTGHLGSLPAAKPLNPERLLPALPPLLQSWRAATSCPPAAPTAAASACGASTFRRTSATTTDACLRKLRAPELELQPSCPDIHLLRQLTSGLWLTGPDLEASSS